MSGTSPLRSASVMLTRPWSAVMQPASTHASGHRGTPPACRVICSSDRIVSAATCGFTRPSHAICDRCVSHSDRSEYRCSPPGRSAGGQACTLVSAPTYAPPSPSVYRVGDMMVRYSALTSFTRFSRGTSGGSSSTDSSRSHAAAAALRAESSVQLDASRSRLAVACAALTKLIPTRTSTTHPPASASASASAHGASHSTSAPNESAFELPFSACIDSTPSAHTPSAEGAAALVRGHAASAPATQLAAPDGQAAISMVAYRGMPPMGLRPDSESDSM
mmetsp:Transcript_28878/g.94002  ORF Transcript_28878/g.94002 Transcript_28878/m.94002 type:complete len:277 (-) Transcript_28878:639-1469(-)